MKIWLTYVGKRLSNKDKLLQEFQDEGGQTCCFTGVKWPLIGHRYEANKTKEGVTIPTRPKVHEEVIATEEQITKWTALEQAAEEQNKQRLLAKRHARDPEPLKAAVKALRPLLRGLSFGQRERLMERLFDLASRSESDDRQ